MANGQFRVFLSAVTSEFGKARDALSADLRSRGLLVSVQSDFRQEAGAGTLMEKLHDYSHGCDAVVCMVGRRAGERPPTAAAEPFGRWLPAGFAEASYTQWEFFFARGHKKRLSIYVAGEDYAPDRHAPPDDGHKLQAAFEQHLVGELGLDRSYFANEDQLCRAVLKEDWPAAREGHNADTPSRLVLIYNDYRDAYLSQKYYGHLIRVATRRDDQAQADDLRVFYTRYAEFAAELRHIVDDIRAERRLSDKSWARFRRVRARIAKLEKLEPFPDRSLAKRFQREVNHEIPVESLWMPPVPRAAS
jgi:hypothetical protein